MEDAEVEGVQHEKSMLPIGPWARDKHLLSSDYKRL